MMFRYSLLIFIGAILFCANSYAQKDSSLLVTLDVKEVTVKEFISQLEKQTGVYFYYDANQVDSGTITIIAKQQPLRMVLDQVFSKIGLSYVIDNGRYIFVTKGRVLNLSLPAGFFNALNKDKDKIVEKAIIENEDKAERTKDQKAALENKLYEIGDKSANNSKNVFTLAGYVTDAKTGEPVAGASLFVEKLKQGVTTDQYGYYSISLPRGRHVLSIQSIAMKDSRRQVSIYNDGKMNIELQSTVMTLKSVTISGQKISNVKGTQMGLQKMDIRTIKQSTGSVRRGRCAKSSYHAAGCKNRRRGKYRFECAGWFCRPKPYFI